MQAIALSGNEVVNFQPSAGGAQSATTRDIANLASGAGNGLAAVVNSMSALRVLSLAGVSIGAVVFLQQYYAGLGKGSGAFELLAGTIVDNGGTLIASSASGKYWSRILGTGPFEPEMFGSVQANVTAAGYYSSLAALQAIYPFATSLNNTLDWLGIKAVDYWCYASQGGNSTVNNTAGAIQLGNQYYVDQPLVLNTKSLTIKAVNPGMWNQLASWATLISYVGVPGNESVHAPIMSVINPAAGIVPDAKYDISGIVFNGLGGSMSGNIAASGWVDGLHIGPSQSSRVSNIGLTGTLCDGVVVTGPNEFLDIGEQCNAYKVLRDALSIPPLASSFTTTTRAHGWEFGQVGRYDFNIWGSTEACTHVYDNDHEGSYATSPYVLDPPSFAQGVVASCLFVSCNNLHMHDERFESVSSTPGYMADVHLVDINQNTLENMASTPYFSLMCTALGPKVGNGSVPGLSQAGTNYVATYGYLNLTDARNISVGTASSYYAGTDGQGLILRNISGMTNLFTAGGISGTFGGGLQPAIPNPMNRFEDVSFAPLNVSTYANGNITLVSPIGNATVSPYNFAQDIFFNASNLGLEIGTTPGVPAVFDYFNSRTQNGSSYQSAPSVCTSAWVGNIAVVATFQLGGFQPFIRPTLANENGYYYQYIGNGTTQASEPSWTSGNHSTPGSVFLDGNATITCVGQINFTADQLTGNSTAWVNGQRQFVSHNSVQPTLGWYNAGDLAVARLPSAGFSGNIATNAGYASPGTWVAKA